MPGILAIGDIHFRPTEVLDAREFTNEVCNHANRIKPDAIILLGDLLHDHEKVHSVALREVLSLIKRLRNYGHLYVLVGNHDMDSNQEFLTDHHWMGPLKEWDHVTIVDRPMIREEGGIRCALTPFVPTGRLSDALNSLGSVWWKNVEIVFGHQEIVGAKMGPILSENGDVWNPKWPFLISGHIHDFQRVGENVLYTGSALQVASSEKSGKRILHIESLKHITEIPIHAGRRRILRITVDDMPTVTAEACKGYSSVQVEGNIEDLKSVKKSRIYKKLVTLGIKIMLKPPKPDRTKTRNTQNISFNDALSRRVSETNDSRVEMIYKSLLASNK